MGEEVKSESGKTSKIDLYEILFHDFEISQNAKTIEFRNQIAKKFNLLFHETYDTYDSAQNYEPRLQLFQCFRDP